MSSHQPRYSKEAEAALQLRVDRVGVELAPYLHGRVRDIVASYIVPLFQCKLAGELDLKCGGKFRIYNIVSLGDRVAFGVGPFMVLWDGQAALYFSDNRVNYYSSEVMWRLNDSCFVGSDLYSITIWVVLPGGNLRSTRIEFTHEMLINHTLQEGVATLEDVVLTVELGHRDLRDDLRDIRGINVVSDSSIAWILQNPLQVVLFDVVKCEILQTWKMQDRENVYDYQLCVVDQEIFFSYCSADDGKKSSIRLELDGSLVETDYMISSAAPLKIGNDFITLVTMDFKTPGEAPSFLNIVNEEIAMVRATMCESRIRDITYDYIEQLKGKYLVTVDASRCKLALFE